MEPTRREQRGRIHALAAMAGVIFVHMFVCWMIAGFDQTRLPMLAGIFALAMAGLLLLNLCVLLEWNLSLKDPDLALPRMLWVVTMLILTVPPEPQARGLIILFGLGVIAAFASRLHTRGLVCFSVWTLSVYILCAAWQTNAQVVSWLTEVGTLLMVALLSIGAPLLYRRETITLENSLVDSNRERRQMVRRLQEMAVCDESTGVGNRRSLIDFLDRQKGVADRYGRRFSLCLVDVAPVGDNRLLRETAARLSAMLRAVDWIGRIDEGRFAVVLCETTQFQARAVAERLRSRLPADGWQSPLTVAVTEYRQNEEIFSLLHRGGRLVADALRARNDTSTVTPAQEIRLV